MCPYDIGPVGQMLTVKFMVPDEPLIMGDIVGIDVSFVIMGDCSYLLADEGIIRRCPFICFFRIIYFFNFCIEVI